MNIILERQFLKSFYEALFSSIGYCRFYQKYVVVEPICMFDIKNDIACNLIDLTKKLYKIDNIGQHVAAVIDEEAGGYIEQAFVLFSDFIFICDNPILFPNNRLRDLYNFLSKKPCTLEGFNGLIHYHIDQPYLNHEDMSAMRWFLNRMKPLNKKKLLSLVMSQIDLKSAFERKRSSDPKSFSDFMFSSLENGKIKINGAAFSSAGAEKIDIMIDLPRDYG